jgi:hypothetical protein
VDRQIASIIQEGSGADQTRIDEVIFVQNPAVDFNASFENQTFVGTGNDCVLYADEYGMWNVKIRTDETEKTDVTEGTDKRKPWLYVNGRKPNQNAPVRAFMMGDANGSLSSSPDGKWSLEIVASGLSPEKEGNIDIFRTLKGTGKASGKTFTLSPFDFPLTDNTLLSDGNRFAVVLDEVAEDAMFANTDVQSGIPYLQATLVFLKIIWFPKNYFTPRERPIDYGKFLEKTDLKRE